MSAQPSKGAGTKVSESHEPPEAAPTARLNPLALSLARALLAESDGGIEIVSDDQQSWLDLEEKASTMAFAEARGDELQIVPFVGDVQDVLRRRYVQGIQPSWLDGEQELVVNLSAGNENGTQEQLLGHLRAARDYWAKTVEPPSGTPLPPIPSPEVGAGNDIGNVDFTAATEAETDEATTETTVSTVEAQLRADISEQWSWASSAARIPQVADLDVDVSEPVAHARITVTVRDSDLQYGSVVVHDGSLPVQGTFPRSVNVPLSPRVMSQVEERRAGECTVMLEDVATGRVLGTVVQAVDIQPRDLWNWDGDARNSGLGPKMRATLLQINELLKAEPDHPQRTELDRYALRLKAELEGAQLLARSLLASFVRPNHPEVAVLAREAATIRGAQSGDAAFGAFQSPERDSTEREAVRANVDASVDAVYEAVRRRRIAYPSLHPAGTTPVKGSASGITAK